MPTRPKFWRPGKPLRARALVRTQDKAERDRFYGSAHWGRLRLAFLAEHPVCARCKRAEATIVHHIQERLERPDLQYDPDNLEALCSPCHTAHHKRKT
jgi:5-methylcytosine-specific restriction enzyme A